MKKSESSVVLSQYFNIFNLATPSHSSIFTLINHNKLLQNEKVFIIGYSSIVSYKVRQTFTRTNILNITKKDTP